MNNMTVPLEFPNMRCGRCVVQGSQRGTWAARFTLYIGHAFVPLGLGEACIANV